MLNDVGVFQKRLWLVLAHLVSFALFFSCCSCDDNAHKFVAREWLRLPRSSLFVVSDRCM